VSFSSWTPQERLICGGFCTAAVGCLIYALKQGVALMSAEFFSMLAVLSLLLGLALTPSILLKPLQESLGGNLQAPLRIALGLFCAFQLAAVLRLLLA
jgi:hypothetical protein